MTVALYTIIHYGGDSITDYEGDSAMLLMMTKS